MCLICAQFQNLQLELEGVYEYVNSNIPRTSRFEFNQYLQWVTKQLAEHLQWSTNIKEVNSTKHGFFLVDHNNHSHFAKNLVIGTGPQVNIPKPFQNFLSETCFHTQSYLIKKNNITNKDSIAIVGGGQSGAEILLDLLSQDFEFSNIYWLSARHHFAPLDESNFANEWFTPYYIDYFFSLNEVAKQKIIQANALASDGITPETIDAIYKKIYELRIKEHSTKVHILASRQVNTIELKEGSKGLKYLLSMHNQEIDRYESVEAAAIILATGYLQKTPDILNNLKEKIHIKNGSIDFNKDFSMNYNGVGKIYAVNLSKHTYGISEPNLSIAAWRASIIVNSIANKNIFKCPQNQTLLTLNHEEVL